MKKREEIALFRCGIIAPLLLLEEDKGKKKEILEDLVKKRFNSCSGGDTTLSKYTILRWLRLYERNGFNALLPKERKDKRKSRVLKEEIIRRAKELLEENKKRTLDKVIFFLEQEFPEYEGKLKRTTLYRGLKKEGFNFKGEKKRYIPFSYSQPNALWQADTASGPPVLDEKGKEKKTKMFLVIDDFSRDIMHCEFYLNERLPCLEDTFRKSILKKGLPARILVDNALSSSE